MLSVLSVRFGMFHSYYEGIGVLMRISFIRRALIIALLTSICTTLLAVPAAAAPVAPLAPGALDAAFAGFNNDGIAFDGDVQKITDMVTQPDGRIVAVGFTGTANQMSVFRYASNGQRDLTFGSYGKVSYADFFSASRVALQSDGKIVVVGTRNDDFQIVRLTPTGALDSSFDNDGWLNDIDTQLSIPKDVIVQSDGKIVVCGYAEVGGDADFGIARYTTSGTRDISFSGDGKMTVPFGAEDMCESVVQQLDGKLVLAGSRESTSTFGDNDFAVARLLSNGALDGTFDGDGKLTTGFGGEENATDVALQSDGHIVVLGAAPIGTNKSFIARYLASGKLDSTFDGDGKRSIPIDRLTKLAIQPDGKLLALGSHENYGQFNFALYRLLPTGELDKSFDYDGNAWLDFGGRDIGEALALQADGRILVGGSKDTTGVLARLWQDGTAFDTGGQQIHTPISLPIYPPGSDPITSAVVAQSNDLFLVAGELRNITGLSRSDAFITRFTSSGMVDPTFGENGTARLWIGNFNAARAIAIQPDGKIVIAGYSTWYGGWDEFMVARFQANGAPDTTFGENGNNYRLANFAGDASFDNGYALALAPDGKIVVAGTAWNGSSQVWGVARWNSNGTPDNSFAGDGKTFLNFGPGSAAYAIVVQPDNRIVLGGKTGANDFALARLLENGAPDANFGPSRDGSTITDMGGNDSIAALALASNGWIYAAGYSWRGGADDFVLAQYQPSGVMPQCQSGQTCNYWPQGKRSISIGGSDSAYAIALRGDNKLVAAGCSDWHTAAVQVSTTTIDQPIVFQTDFVGHFDCAFGVQFVGANKDKIVLAGQQAYDSDNHIALARFQTTAYQATSTTLSSAEDQRTEPTPEPTETSTAPTPTEQPTEQAAEPTPAEQPTEASAEPTPAEQPTEQAAEPTPAVQSAETSDRATPDAPMVDQR
jgi:uncharacterized delta-60 repeat protein